MPATPLCRAARALGTAPICGLWDALRVTDTATRIPFVDYLVVEGEPHLVASECTQCGARFFDRRNACASCFGTEFKKVAVATEGEVRAFTIVSLAAPGIPVPFVAAVVDCGGTSVRANLINVEPDPEHVRLGMKVRLLLRSADKNPPRHRASARSTRRFPDRRTERRRDNGFDRGF